MGCRQETGITCGSPHDSKSSEIRNRNRKIISLEIVCLKMHMSGVRLCGNVGFGKGVTSVNYTSSHQTFQEVGSNKSIRQNFVRL